LLQHVAGFEDQFLRPDSGLDFGGRRAVTLPCVTARRPPFLRPGIGFKSEAAFRPPCGSNPSKPDALRGPKGGAMQQQETFRVQMRFGPTSFGPIQKAPFPEKPVPDTSDSESDTEIPWNQLSEATRARILDEVHANYDPAHRGDSD